MQTKLLIKGKFTTGKGDLEEVLDPATGKVIAEVAEASEEQVNAAVLAAAGALDGWSRTAPKDRAALLLKLADRIEADADAFAELESRNCGKPLAAVKGDEIPAIADVFRFFAGAARTMTGAIAGEYLTGFTSMIRRDPVGVVASIAPWNYPLMMAAWKLSPAVAAGNTVVLKPSEQTPLTQHEVGEGEGNLLRSSLRQCPRKGCLGAGGHGFLPAHAQHADRAGLRHQRHAQRVGQFPIDVRAA